MKTQILDHGSLELIESWGSDERIIEAGRQSVGGEFVSWEPYQAHPSGDVGLLRHFLKKKNTGPFEFVGMVIEVVAPVMVIWQWVRHRTQSYAIMSSRYVPIDQEDHLPTIDRCLQDGGKNRQAAAMTGAATLTPQNAEPWLAELAGLQRRSQAVYRNGLELGVPKEVARLSLTFGRFFQMRVSANLHNWLRFLTLRMDDEAQYEIRQYANAVGALVAEKFPRTWELCSEQLRKMS